MAETTINTSSSRQKWSRETYRQYVRQSGFMPFMGASQSMPIHVRRDMRNERGDTINLPLLYKLSGAPQRGSQTVRGNEEALANYNFAITLDWVRKGVAVSEAEQFKTEIELLTAGRAAIRDYFAELLRDDIVDQLNTKNGTLDQVSVSGGSTAAAATRNAWIAANSDRVLIGNATSNYNATFSTALANCDTTNDKLSVAAIRLARRLARSNSNPVIRPAVAGERESAMSMKTEITEQYVLFCGARSRLDLMGDTALTPYLNYAGDRFKDNPFYRAGDIVIDDVIVREIPEITQRCLHAAAGASSADVEPYFMCGAQAVGYAVGRDFAGHTEKADYGFIEGAEGRELRGISKLRYNGKDHGVFTGYVAVS